MRCLYILLIALCALLFNKNIFSRVTGLKLGNKSKLRTLWGWKFKQKINITMIDISCKFYFQKCHDIYILHQFTWGFNRTPNVSPNMKRIAYNSLFMPCKNWRESLTSVIFVVNRYYCFMDKKNAFSVCKPLRKTTLSLIKILLVFMKKA